MKPPLRPLSALLLVLILWSCGGDSTSPPVDDTSPVITVGQPTSDAEHLTSESPVEVSGTAHDDSGVDRVEWSLSGGASGTAEGTTSWRIPALELSEGEQTLTVTAFDAHDNAAEATLTLILDQTAPVVALAEPVDGGEYRTMEAAVAVAGTASDTRGLDRIDWAIEGGASGTATGTGTWQIDALPLEHGTSQITITALDLAGNVDTATFTATRVQALGDMSIDPSVILTNSTRQIRVTLALGPGLDTGAHGVRLVEVDQAGAVVEELGTLEDNGNLDQGDDILGDGVYSALLTISRSDPQNLRLQVLADVEGGATPEARSSVRVLSINTPTSTADDQLLLSVQHDAAASLSTMLSQGTDLATAVQNLAQQIADQDGVASVETQGETSIAITYESRLLGGLILALEGGSGTGGTRGGTWTGTLPVEAVSLPLRDTRPAATTAVTPDRFPRPAAADTIRRAREPGVPLSQQTRGSTAPTAARLTDSSASTATSESAILNQKVLIYAPYEAVWAPYNEGPDLVTMLDASVLEFDVDYLSNQEATIEALTRLTDYGLVVLATHGSAGRHFLTGEIATDEKREAYDAERQAGQIVVWTMIEINEAEDSASIREDVFGVTDTFVDALPGVFPQSLIVNNSCESTLRDDLGDAFLDKGAEAYTGFSAIVTSSFAVDMVLDLIDPMVGSGLDRVGSAHTEGQIDPAGSWNAEFELRGNEELGYVVEFANGGFESGSLGGWTALGDGRVITRLGPEEPVAGQFMGVISTGLGYTTSSGAISQSIAVPEDAQGLRFNWNFISEEFLEWIGTEFQDNFRISIILPDQSTQTLFSRTVDDIADEFSCTDTGGPDCGLIPASPDIVFDQGDVHMTGWQTLELDLTPYRGSIVTLVFSARDVGDSYYDTAILLDGMVLY